MDDTGTTSTPASTSTESSATATVETSRPTTATEAFDQVTAQMDRESADQGTATTAQSDTPIETGVIHTSTDKKGPIPFDVHSKALENARTKAGDEALAKHREQFGWAEGLDRQAVEQADRIGRLYQQDRGAYVRQLLSEAVTDPQLAPIVRSEAARILAGSRQAEPAIEPDIPVLDANGQIVNHAFSAERVQQLVTRAVTEAIGKEVAPIKQTIADAKARQQDRQTRTEAKQAAETLYEKASAWHGFKDHEPAIAAALEQHADWSIHDAYIHVLQTDILPKQAQVTEAKVLESHQTKAAAQTVDGSGKSATTPARPRNPKELAAFMRQVSQ